MSSIKGRDTKPEMQVRRRLHAAGLRYLLHVSKLPGKPDIVFPSRRLALFVHGCFWHGCRHCRDGTKRIKSNTSYWLPKLRRNRERDLRHVEALNAAGWEARVLWECETRSERRLDALIQEIRAMPSARRPAARAAPKKSVAR